MTFRLAKPPSPSHESPADPTDSEAESGCRAPRLSVAAAAAAGTVTVTVATIMSLSRAAGGPVTVAAAAADHRPGQARGLRRTVTVTQARARNCADS